MNKKFLLFTTVTSLLAGGTLAVATQLTKKNAETYFSVNAETAPTDGNKYDAWIEAKCNKAGHIYFHYNRGADKKASDYNDYCLWLWNQSDDEEGTLWAFSGNPVISSKITLKPMSTHFMTKSELGVGTGDDTYIDQYGVIVDVDLNKEGLVGGKTGEAVNLKDAAELGLLWVDQKSMNQNAHWASDGGRETYVDDWLENKRKNNSWHMFFATGALNNYSFFAGDASQAKENPMNDDEGKYSSTTDVIYDDYLVSPTSKKFQELGIGYQVFVASFRDSDGDGYGDIRGIINSLDYFKELNVDCLWLTPIQQSDSYHGYDISDYYAIDKRFGTIDDYRELIYKAHQKGIKVLMDLVLNHTSKGNVWFTKSQWGVNSGVPGTENDGTGINWRNVYSWKHANDKIKKISRTEKTDEHGETYYEFGAYQEVTVKSDAEDLEGASWYRDGETNYYYYGKFGSGMPEINYECKDTRKLVIDMAKYWLSFGLDGYRLDAVKHIYMKDEVDDTGSDVIIKDIGTKKSFDDERGKDVYKPYDYSTDLTKNIAWWKEFSNELKAIYPDCFLVGENFDGYGQRMAAYYQGLDSQFDFANYYHIPAWIYTSGGNCGVYASKTPDETFNAFRSNGTLTISNKDGSKQQVPAGKRSDFINGAYTSNHDVMRAINQANGDGNLDETTPNDKITGTVGEIRRAKGHAAITLLNPGISWIYYGDELGMSSNTWDFALPEKYGNTNSIDIRYRQPMLWEDTTQRPNYKSGQYKVYELDEWNTQMSTEHKGVSVDNQGKYTANNEIFTFYKEVCALKKLYPKNAKVTFDGSTDAILIMNVTGEGKALKVYINTGKAAGEYKLNPGDTYSKAGATSLYANADKGSNIGSVEPGVIVYKEN